MGDFIHPYLPELTIRDYNTYLRYKRGLRYQIRRDYGWFAARRFRGDTTLIALLSDGLAGREATLKKVWRTPFRHEWILCQTRGIITAAQISVLMAWHNLMDRDTRRMNLRQRISRMTLQLFLRRAFVRASEENPALERLICQQREQAIAQMMVRGHSYERAAEPTANVYAALYAAAAPEDVDARSWMHQVGVYVGRGRFFLRKVENYEKEKRLGHYNIYAENGLSRDAALANARRQCTDCALHLGQLCNRMPFRLHRRLLENILVIHLQKLVDSLGSEEEAKNEEWELP